jgi:taurine dioxygenase
LSRPARCLGPQCGAWTWRGRSTKATWRILLALGRHGILRFAEQQLDLASLKRFSELFGEIQGNPIRDADPAREYPEIGVLSNPKEDGKYIGSPDAGQDWHTDMTYREVPGFVNVLYGICIPHRDGKLLGGTEFSNMHLAYEDLPCEIKKPAGANDRYS